MSYATPKHNRQNQQQRASPGGPAPTEALGAQDRGPLSFEDGPPVSIRRRGLPQAFTREVNVEPSAGAIQEDPYPPQPYSSGPSNANSANKESVEDTSFHSVTPPSGRSSPPRSQFPAPPIQISGSNRNPFMSRPTQALQNSQSYSHPKPIVRVPPPPFLSAATPRESYWTSPSGNLPASDSPTGKSTGDASIDGSTLKEAWNAPERNTPGSAQHSDDEVEQEDEEVDLETGKLSPVDTRAYPYPLYQIGHRATATTVPLRPNGQSPNRYQSREQTLVGGSDPLPRLTLRTEEVPLPDSDEVESPLPRGDSPSPAQRLQQQASPLQRRASEVTGTSTSPQDGDVILPRAQVTREPQPRERKLPTPPSARDLATPPNLAQIVPLSTPQNQGPSSSYHTPMGPNSATPYHTPHASGNEDPSYHVSASHPEPIPASRMPATPMDMYEDVSPQREPESRSTAQERSSGPMAVPISRANTSGQAPDRSLPLREDDYRARSARPQSMATNVNWYEPPTYAPLEFVPGFVYLDPHYRSNLALGGSPTASSTLLNNGTDQELNLTTPRSPLMSLPAYDYSNDRYPNEVDDAHKDEPRHNPQFDAAEVQHALWVLEQQRALYAPQPRPHYVQPNAQQFETRTRPTINTDTTIQREEGERPPSSTSSHQYSHPRPEAPVPPTPQSNVMSTAPTPYPVVFSPAPFAGRPDQLRNFRNYSQPLPPRRPYYPGGPRIFTPSLPSTAMSSPFAPPINPFLPPIRPSGSVVSSPSHHPLPLPVRRRPPKPRKGFIPPRVASTLPPSSDTADDMGDDDGDDGELTEGRVAAPEEREQNGAEEDESDLLLEVDSDDRLNLELHPSHISNQSRRRRRFEERWRQLVAQFHELDRTTDATMLLFASLPDADGPQSGTHMLASRAIRRSPEYIADAHQARASFSHISSSRRRIKIEQARLERQRQDEAESAASETSDMRRTLASIEAMALRAESQGGEAGLKSALRATLDGLRQMQRINEEREERRRDEAARQRREAAHIEELLNSALSGNA